MSKRKYSSFKGQPKTSFKKDKHGKEVSIVLVTALTPLRQHIVDFLSKWLGIGAMLGCAALLAMNALENTFSPWSILSIPMAGGIVYLASRFLISDFLRKEKMIVFTESEIRIRKWWGGWTRFDRQHPHAFALREHPKAKVEKDAHVFAVNKARQKGKVIKKNPYYQHSYELVMEYFGEQKLIVAIYGPENAKQIQRRLQAVDAILPGLSQSAGMTPTSPADDWAQNPGGFI